jgi:hypothetical protein
MRTEDRDKVKHGHFRMVRDFTRVEETPQYFHELQQAMGAGHEAEAFAIVAQKHRLSQVEKKLCLGHPRRA